MRGLPRLRPATVEPVRPPPRPARAAALTLPLLYAAAAFALAASSPRWAGLLLVRGDQLHRLPPVRLQRRQLHRSRGRLRPELHTLLRLWRLHAVRVVPGVWIWPTFALALANAAANLWAAAAALALAAAANRQRWWWWSGRHDLPQHVPLCVRRRLRRRRTRI